MHLVSRSKVCKERKFGGLPRVRELVEEDH